MVPTSHERSSETFKTNASNWFRPLPFCVMLGACIFAAYPEVVLGGHTFVFRDFGFFGYPLAFHHRESFWRGEIPLWNPLSSCGLPFLAQWNTLVLYPGSLFYLLFPLSWSLGVFCLAHQWLAGMGMYFLARRWTGSRLAASVAGLVYAFNGLTLNSLIWPAVMAAFGWMPWVVLLTERAWQHGGKAIVPAAVVGALQMLSGVPEIVLFTWLVLGVFLLGEMVSKRCWRKNFLRVLPVVFLVTLLSAAQILPFLDLLKHSQRNPGFERVEWAMPGTGWANLLVPLFRCVRNAQGVYFDAAQSWTTSYYVGVGTLLLAILAFIRVRDRRVRLLGGLAVFSLVLALGSHAHVYTWLRNAVPQIDFMRYPIKFVILLVFSAPILAGFGIRQLYASPPSTVRPAWRTGIILAGILLALICAILWFDRQFPLFPQSWPATLENGLGRIAFLALALGTLALTGSLRRAGLKVAAHLVLLMLLFTDVIRHMPRQNPTVPRAVFEPGLLKLNPQPRPGESRALMTYPAHLKLLYASSGNAVNDFIVSRLGLFLNCNLLDDIAQVHGFFPLYLREPDKVREALKGAGEKPSPGLSSFLGVSQITAPGKYYDWEGRSSWLPLVTAGQRPAFSEDAAAFQALTGTNFSPEQVVYLPNEARASIQFTNESRIKINRTRFTAHKVDIDLEASEAGLVVIAQSYYHPWRAYVDGKPTHLWRANYAFQAIQVPAGNRSIVLKYSDTPFYWGVLFSVAGLLGCAAASACSMRSR